jgi:predicted permease
MGNVLKDLHYGARLLLRSKGFAAVAILTLALGIGANVAVFSIVDATLLRPLPYRDPQRLVDILDAERGASKLFGSWADFQTYRQHARSFEEIAVATWAVRGQTLTGRGPARGVMAVPVSESFFRMLGAGAALGRTFTADDLARGCSVVLSHGFWENVLGGDPQQVGQTIALEHRPCTVVGVMPARFAFYPNATQLWTLLTPDFEPKPADIPMISFGRLRSGVSLAQAQNELAVLHAALHQADGKERSFTPAVDDLQQEFTWLAGRNLRSTLWILLGAVALVLLVACWNVAGLLLGRGFGRRRELAVRAALGGGRRRLFGQLLAEGTLLALAGGVLGVLLAFVLVVWFRSVNPVELPPGSDVRVSLPVLGFAAAACVAATLLFGLVPAWKMSLVNLSGALKSGGRGVAAGRHRMARLLVAAEMAGSVLLLAGAGVLMQSVLRMRATPLGFDPEHVFRARIALGPDSYPKPEQRVQFYQALLDKLNQSAGIHEAALASILPPGIGSSMAIQIQGRPLPPPDREIHDVSQQSVSPGYLKTMRVPLLLGRDFDARDIAASEPAAIVNQALVDKYFPSENPLGRQIRFSQTAPWTTIVGVIGTEKRTTVYQEMGFVDAALAYRPMAQVAPQAETIAVRAAGDAVPVAAAIRRAAAALDPHVAVEQVQPIRDDFAKLLAYPRFRAVVLAGFALFALLLAAIGLEGVLAQAVAQRTQEVGVRMALGARPAAIVKLIAWEGGLPVLAGLAIGLLAAGSLGRLLQSLLYRARPTDPLMLGGISAVLLAVAALAIVLPARRAARTDPMTALRSE